MNLIIMQDRIINLDNTTCFRRFKPGYRYAILWASNRRVSKHTIWVEFATPIGDSKTFDSAVESFEYANAKAADNDWQRLRELAIRQ